ncbi:MAG: ribonuclease P protein component [Bacteroidales bacterium]|jgi:ribonuclease P protein component
MPDKSETFRKNERLCNKKAIAELFENGISFYSFPFQIIWIKSPDELTPPARVAISVSKKYFRRAVRRNLIRRRIREAYRRNKYILYEFLGSRNVSIIFIIIFKDKTIPEYTVIEKTIRDSIGKLIADITNKEPVC